MAMKILVVHESGVARSVIREYILTEFSDSMVELVAMPDSAAVLMKKEKYDAVFSGLKMSPMDGLALHKHMIATKVNNDTPFVLITSSYNEEQENRLAELGLKHVLPVPFSAKEMRKMLQTVARPRNRRTHPRYGVAGSIVTLKFGQKEVQTEIINISVGGLLCALQDSKASLDIIAAGSATVVFSEEYGGAVASDIDVCLLRLAVESWHKDYSPEYLRMAFKFPVLRSDAKFIFKDAFRVAQKKLLDAQEIVKKETI